MTYDPYRNRSPRNPYEKPYRVGAADSQTGFGAALLLGALLLAAIGGFIYYGSSDQPSVASNDMRPPIIQPKQNVPAMQPETTGAGSAQQ